IYITSPHLFIKTIRDNAVNNNLKEFGKKDRGTYIVRIYNYLYSGLKDLVVEPADNITFDEWLTYLDRRTETHRLKIINNLGGYSSSFNKRMLRVEFNSKFSNIKAIEVANFIK
ncbi:uncharacterized protein B0T23DRAFT_328235, partial [Neurospora hispaniola]